MHPFLKDILREIAHTLSRFVSILLITMLGAMLVVGISATAIHMRDAADAAYRRHNLYDLQIRHPLGFDAQSVKTIRDIPGVASVMPTFIVDAYVPVRQSMRTLRTYALPDTDSANGINIPALTEGRLPAAPDEIAVERRLLREGGLNLGDTVYLQLNNEPHPHFISESFTITGVIASPLYITGERGRTHLGDGNVRYISYLHPGAYALPHFTDIYVVKEGSRGLHQVSEAYNAAALGWREDIEAFLSTAEIPAFVFTRQNGIAFESYFQDTLRLQSVGRVFPLLFFLVAVLVSLTTLSRMVEEQRGQIGIYKALGYRPWVILLKYAAYGSLSGLAGGIIGAVLGAQIIPRIIFNAYSHLYEMPVSGHPVPWGIALLAVGAAVGCILATAVITCFTALAGEAAALMRPKAPKPGKRVWLERIPFVWKRFGFIGKVTARNIFRYKRRFIMTLAGIAGCTALLVTAFGLRDSIGSVAQRQYDRIINYDALVFTRNLTVEDKTELMELTQGSVFYIRSISADARTDAGGFGATVIIPAAASSVGGTEMMADHIRLMPAGGFAPPHGRGAFVTEKLAREMRIGVGDYFVLTMPDGSAYRVRAAGVVENYVMHYIYMDAAQYTALFGRGLIPNGFLIRGEADIPALMAHGAVLGVSNVAAMRNGLTQQTDALGIVTWVILVMAGILAFVVLFNLTEINRIERRRELATIKVLGFGDIETAMYLYRENFIVTLMGIGLGLVGGIYLNGYILATVEIDILKFPRIILPTSFALAAGLSILFALLVNAATYSKLSAIDMVESLKSVD